MGPARPELGCAFYRTTSGKEPVREWLRSFGKTVSKAIGSDILTVQWNWPIGKPYVDGLGNGLYEVRSTHDKVEYRVFFCVAESTMILPRGRSRTGAKAHERGDERMKSKHIGSTFASYLAKEQMEGEVRLLALKKTIALQLRRAMERAGISQSTLAHRMHTSRTVVIRILDPGDTGVTIATLSKASRVLGLSVDVQLRPQHSNRQGRHVGSSVRAQVRA